MGGKTPAAMRRRRYWPPSTPIQACSKDGVGHRSPGAPGLAPHVMTDELEEEQVPVAVAGMSRCSSSASAPPSWNDAWKAAFTSGMEVACRS